MSTSNETRVTPWEKSTYSNTGDCVELRRNGDVIELRDSKDPDGPVLRYTTSELAAFLKGATDGQFNHLI